MPYWFYQSTPPGMQDPGILAGPFRSQWCLCNSSNLGVQNGSCAPLSHLVLLRRGKATAKHTLSQHPESTALHLSPLRLSPPLETLLARAALPSHTHAAGHVLQELGCNELTHLQPFQFGRQAVRRPPAHISLPFSTSEDADEKSAEPAARYPGYPLSHETVGPRGRTHASRVRNASVWALPSLLQLSSLTKCRLHQSFLFLSFFF
jgi:hypothetical protein